MSNKETRDDIIKILESKYSNIKRNGNTINIYLDIRTDERTKRIAELESVYDFLTSSIKNRKLFYNKNSSYSSIGHIEILEEYPPIVPKKLDEIRITVKPSLIPELNRPGIQNELIIESMIKNALISATVDSSVNYPTIILKSNNKHIIVLERVRSIIRSSSINPNDPVDIKIISKGRTDNISIKKVKFRDWTSAKSRKTMVESLLDEALRLGGIVRTGNNYVFDPKSGFTAIAKKMSRADIQTYVLKYVNIILVSNFSSGDFNWDADRNTLTINIDKMYSSPDDLKGNVWLLVNKYGNTTFGKYSNFNALFVPESEVPDSTIIVK